MVVIVLIAILAGTLAPNFQGSISTLRLREAVERVVNAMDYCRYAAVGTRRVYGIVFSEDGFGFEIVAEPQKLQNPESLSLASSNGANPEEEAWMLPDLHDINPLAVEREQSQDINSDSAMATLEPVRFDGPQSRKFPEGIRLSDYNFFEEGLAQTEEGDLRILFFPDGSSEFAALVLEAADGDRRKLSLNGVSGVIRVTRMRPEESLEISEILEVEY